MAQLVHDFHHYANISVSSYQAFPGTNPQTR